MQHLIIHAHLVGRPLLLRFLQQLSNLLVHSVLKLLALGLIKTEVDMDSLVVELHGLQSPLLNWRDTPF